MCRSCGPEDGGLSLAEVTSSSGADARGRRDTAIPRLHTPPPRSLGDDGGSGTCRAFIRSADSVRGIVAVGAGVGSRRPRGGWWLGSLALSKAT